jgi:short chain dehydrogenase
VLVARRRAPLDRLAKELTSDGARAHAITADLADTDAIPVLTDRIRATVGDLDAIYYGAAADGFIPALHLTPDRVRELMRGHAGASAGGRAAIPAPRRGWQRPGGGRRPRRCRRGRLRPARRHLRRTTAARVGQGG